jgi:threonine dehydrogenase-like Zn-dependent dehydrogenase
MRVVVLGATGNVGTTLVATGCRLFGNPAAPWAAAALGVDDLATHEGPLEQAPELYEKFQKKQDGCIKVVLHP